MPAASPAILYFFPSPSRLFGIWPSLSQVFSWTSKSTQKDVWLIKYTCEFWFPTLLMPPPDTPQFSFHLGLLILDSPRLIVQFIIEYPAKQVSHHKGPVISPVFSLSFWSEMTCCECNVIWMHQAAIWATNQKRAECPRFLLVPLTFCAKTNISHSRAGRWEGLWI